MNKTDKDILNLLKQDARLTPKNIAAAAGIGEEEAKKRVAALEESGVIIGYTVLTNSEEMEEEEVEALIEVKVTPQRGHGFDKIAREIAGHAEVKNLYLMSGGYDLAVIVHCPSLRAVSRFVSEKISTYDTVLSTATHFILKKYKVEGAKTAEKEGENRLSVQA